MGKFKRDDCVMFARTGMLDGWSQDWAAGSNLVIGEVYTVQFAGTDSDLDVEDDINYIRVGGSWLSLDERYFDMYEEA